MTAPTDPYVPGHGDSTYAVRHYDLELDYRLEGNRLDGRATITATASETLDVFALDLAFLDVTRLMGDGRRPASYRHRGSRVRVRPAAPSAQLA